MDMRLASDDWDLVSKPTRLEKFGQKLARFVKFVQFRLVLAIALLVLLLYADIPDGPVIVTDELSFEVVNQMEEASRTCRSTSKDSNEASCAGEVWKACHMAKQDLVESREAPTRNDEYAVWYLCDHAVTVNAGDLGMALASRYRNGFFDLGLFKTVEIDEGKASFLLFIDLINSDLYSVYDRSYYGELASNPGHEPDWSRYKYMSDDTEEKLSILLSSIRHYLHPYRDYGSAGYSLLYARGLREEQDLQSLGNNLWQEPSGAIYAHSITEQSCLSARVATRENQLGSDELLDRCFQLADDCINRTDSFSVSCSLAKGVAKFESMWQRLPEICATSDERIEESAGDVCYGAALAICKYQNVSPDDEWIDQLISMRDFACAAAARTPDLLYVKVDDRVPSHDFLPQS